MAKKIGRRKGSRSKGYFYRTGRGWVTKENGQFVPLTDEQGERLKDKDLRDAEVKAAYQRWLRTCTIGVPEKVPESATETPVGVVCGKYLEDLRARAGAIGPNPRGLAKTYLDRGETLFDFCFGYPAEYFCGGDREKRAERMADKPPVKIHPGYGGKLCTELTAGDVTDWLNAHTWKEGGRRTRVQAVKRAFNFAVEQGLIAENPIRGYRVSKSKARVTYLTPEQEQAMLEHATPAFALALKVCIRTGARFGCEFAQLTARHVHDHRERMEWVFKADESKTKKLRRVLISDPEIMDIVRRQILLHPEGPIFRNHRGEPWERRILSHNFRRVKEKIRKKGVLLDPDACMYSCRHTYAKRTLEGYWTGKPTSIQTLARLMGNTVQVCMDHYLQFSHADNEMLWDAC